MAAYLIVNFDIDDKEAYREYQKGAVPSLGIGETSRVVAYDTATTCVEGERAGSQTVVLEFESMDAARAAYESKAYQEVLPVRLEATSNHFGVLAEGA